MARLRPRRFSLEGPKRNAKLYMKSKLGVIGLVIIIFCILIAVFAPYLTSNDPVFGVGVAARNSLPAWATIFPQYQGLSVTGYMVSPVDFGTQQGLNQWTLTGVPGGTVTHSISSVVPGPGVKTTPPNPTGSLLVNASIVPKGGNGTVYLPYGQVFFSLSQTFQFTTKPPLNFFLNATVEPVKMSNVSAIYLNYIVSGPAGNYSMSTVQFLLIRTQIELNPSQVGTWTASTMADRLLPESGIPAFGGAAYPPNVILAKPGTYTFTLQIEAVPSGTNPSISLRVSSVSFKEVGAAFGILGSDDQGRDVWSEFVWGSRVSLLIGILSGIGAVGLGALLGILSGYLGGFADEVLGRVTDFILVLPFLPLLIVMTLIITQNVFLQNTIYTWVILLFTVLSWPTIAKIIRSQVISVKEREYVEASRALGGGTFHILRKHLLPNVTGLVYSQVALNVSGFILLEAALDFLTVNLYPLHVTTWGIMLTQALTPAISDAVDYHVWWWFFPPGIAIAALSLAFVFVGFALDSVFNPRLRAR